MVRDQGKADTIQRMMQRIHIHTLATKVVDAGNVVQDSFSSLTTNGSSIDLSKGNDIIFCRGLGVIANSTSTSFLVGLTVPIVITARGITLSSISGKVLIINRRKYYVFIYTVLKSVND